MHDCYSARNVVVTVCLKVCFLCQANSCGQALDKKQRVLEKQLGDWKQKCEELVAEVDSCQKESRQHASELFKLKTAHEESVEQLEALRRENKAYQGKVQHMQGRGPPRTPLFIPCLCIKHGTGATRLLS